MRRTAMHDPKGSVKEGYEVTDMNTRVILISLASLVIMTIGGFIIIILVMRGLEESRATLNPNLASPLSAEDANLPEEPTLQQNPVADKNVAIEAAECQLSTWGVISDTAELKRVHIPITTAIKMVAEKKVPYRQQPVMAAIPNATQTP